MKYLPLYMLVLLLLVHCALTDFVIAQHDKHGMAWVEDDIDILETVLDKMFFKRDVRMSLYGGKTNGYYLDDYGILFNIPYPMNYFIAGPDRLESFSKLYSDPEKLLQVATKLNEINTFPDIKLLQDKEIAEIRKTIDRFMSDYVSTMSYASPNHWITLIVDLEQDSWIMNIGDRELVDQIIARVQIKYISALRAGKLSRDEFIRTIQYTYKMNDDTSHHEEIDIFSQIVESYFINKNNDKIRFSNNLNGFYIDGYGLIFLGHIDMIPNFINIVTESSGDKNVAIHRFTATIDSLFDLEKRLDLLEDDVASLISRYGHTLTGLGDDESIEFAFNLRTPTIFNSASKVVYKVKKGDLSKLNDKKIDYTEFKRRFKVTRYD